MKSWDKIKIAVATLIITGLLAIIGAGLLIWSGIYNVAASAGHPAIVQFVLHHAMTQSVRAHAPDLTPPRLDNPALIKLGAAHFATGCAPCHGAPDIAASPVAVNATPPPPPLYSAARDFTPAQLHFIVKHGIKMTAMPPWPTQARDDEVWAMVAFVEALPTLKPGDDARLASASGRPEPDAAIHDLSAPLEAQGCADCHGDQGQGAGAKAPRLAGLSREYIRTQLANFREGARPSGIMRPIAVDLSDAAVARLADYFSEKTRTPGAGGPAPLVAQGAAIAALGLAPGVQSCADCHANPRDPRIPLLDGQDADYLEDQLRLFKMDVRNNETMRRIAKLLSPDQAKAVAAYFASAPQKTASRAP